MKQLGYVATALLLELLAGGCGNNSSRNDGADPPAPVVSVRVEPVVRRTMPVTLVVDGATEVLDRETLVSPMDGTIISMSGEIGAAVAAGDTVAVILARDSEASIAGARRLIEQATTPQQRDEALRAMEVAKEGRRLVSVTAGRGGVVVDRMVSAEQSITTNSELLQLVDLTTLSFLANVPLRDLARVKIGQPCAVRFPSLTDRAFDGTVAAVSAQSDQGSQTTPVRIHFKTEALEAAMTLRVGMVGTAEITIGEHRDVLAVPAAALLRNDIDNSYTLYTVSADSLAHVVPVTVGISADSLVEITAPTLDVGDPVLVTGNYEVGDSTRVTIESGTGR
jgi:membrane fusion protein (multidrug efflux system)